MVSRRWKWVSVGLGAAAVGAAVFLTAGSHPYEPKFLQGRQADVAYHPKPPLWSQDVYYLKGTVEEVHRAISKEAVELEVTNSYGPRPVSLWDGADFSIWIAEGRYALEAKTQDLILLDYAPGMVSAVVTRQPRFSLWDRIRMALRL